VSEVRQNKKYLTPKASIVSVSRTTLEEAQKLLKDIQSQDKGRLNEVSRSIGCRVSREQVETLAKKIDNLLE
jgi:hypothetical protein